MMRARIHPSPSRTIQNFRLRCAMLVKDIASKYTEYEGSGVQEKNMKYYDSTMSTNMGKNILATTATITLKEAIPKFKGTISHGHPTSSNDEKTARTKSLSSHKDE